MQTHTASEIAAIERATELAHSGYLDMHSYLLPVFLKPRPRDARRDLILRLNNRQPAPAPRDTQIVTEVDV